jgi:hypothetical protein
MTNSAMDFHNHREKKWEKQAETDRKYMKASKSLDIRWMRAEEEKIREYKEKYGSGIYENKV